MRLLVRWVTRLLLVVVAVLAAGVFPGAGAAHAHEALSGTVPEAGRWVATRPAEVRLSFVAEPMSLGSAMVVTDGAGVQVQDGAAKLDGRDLVVDLRPADGPATGAYTVTWRVTSADGHPLSGRFAFGVGEPGSVPLTPAEGGSVPAQIGGGGGVLAWALGATALVGVLALVGLRVVLLRRRAPGP